MPNAVLSVVIILGQKEEVEGLGIRLLGLRSVYRPKSTEATTTATVVVVKEMI
jgi:hypothetical protein